MNSGVAITVNKANTPQTMLCPTKPLKYRSDLLTSVKPRFGLPINSTMRHPLHKNRIVCLAKPCDSEDPPKTNLSSKSVLTREMFEKFIAGKLDSTENKFVVDSILTSLQNAQSYVKNAVPGINIGFPLVSMSALFTTLHYGKPVFDAQDACLQILIGYFTYGYDRLLDAMESGHKDNLSDRKKQLYEKILSHKPQVIATLAASFGSVIHRLSQNPQTLPFIPLLLTTFAYKNIKTNNGALKPFYIAAMWTACSVVLPCVLHDKNYSVLSSPQDLLPMALLMFGSTNILDAFDIEEDKEKGINTLPVQLGQKPVVALSVMTVAFAAELVFQRVLDLK